MKVGSCYATSHSGGSAEHAGSRLRGLPREALAFFFAFLLALGSLVPRAYAGTQYNPQMVIDGNLVDGDKKGYMCVNANRFTATLELIGKMGDYVTIDSEKYRALTSAGGFFMVMQRWDELTSYATVDMENSWLGSKSFVDGWLIISGKGNCWYGTFSDSEIEAALVWYERVMSGSSGGGSGGTVTEGDVMETSITCHKDFTWRGYTFSDGVTYRLRFPVNDTLRHFLSQPDYTFSVGFSPDAGSGNTNSVLANVTVWCYTGGLEFDKFVDPVSQNVGWMTAGKTSGRIYYGRCKGQGGNWYYDSSSGTIVVESFNLSNWNSIWGNFDNSCYVGLTQNSYVFPSTQWTSLPSDAFIPLVGFDFMGDDVPEVPEPEPEPDEPVVNPPSPYAPDIGTGDPAPTVPRPTSPNQPVNVTVNQVVPVDDILEALNKIIQELENHCVHLQNKMVECSKYLGELLEQVRDGVADGFDSSNEYQGDLHEDMKSYLKECMQWLVDHMSYNVTIEGDDNTDLERWLALIYMQDGLGEYNSKPIDITQSYTLYADWVDRLLGFVLPDLTDTNLAPVTSAFDALDDKFPFSVPGDVLRIFQSLDRSPVTPVVAVTIPSVLGIPAYTYSFDLSSYDTTMQTIRTIELMAFVVFLLVWARRAFNAEAGGASD